MTPESIEAALRHRLQTLAPEAYDAFDFTATPFLRRLDRAAAIAMEPFVWRCPACDSESEYTVSANTDAPGPNPPVSVYDDEGKPVSSCYQCDGELDVESLAPYLVWNVAIAGAFVKVDEVGDYVGDDDEHTTPEAAVAAATRLMRRDPTLVPVQIIPYHRRWSWTRTTEVLGEVGSVPYLPTHNHRSDEPCVTGCPVKSWEEHKAMTSV